MQCLKRHWPEGLLFLALLYFCLRELGTFPAAWTDDSLYMISARAIAQGEGYGLPILDQFWSYPFIFTTGPTVMFPAALMFKLFGFSVAAARIPMVLFIILCSGAFYHWCKTVSDRKTALWSTALLVSLSAFINASKVTIGEAPALLFLILGLLLMQKRNSLKHDVLAGLSLGLSALSKIAFGAIYPAIGIAWIYVLMKGKRDDLKSLTTTIVVSLIGLLAMIAVGMLEIAGFSQNLVFHFAQTKESTFPLHGNAGILLRAPFLYFQAFLVLGLYGFWHHRKHLKTSVGVTIAVLILIFILSFLGSFGWYRHLLPAHLLLIPFVVIALRSNLHKNVAMVLLALLVLVQGYWQWDHRGSSQSTAAADAAIYIEKNLQDTDLITNIAAIYVRLPKNPQWRFLTNPTLTERVPEQYKTLTPEQECMTFIRSRKEGDSSDWEIIAHKYVIVPPCDI